MRGHYSVELIQDILNSSSCIIEVLQKLGFKSYVHWKKLSKFIQENNICLDKFKKNPRPNAKRKSKEELFVKREKSSTKGCNKTIKQKFLNLGNEYRCKACNVTDAYNGKPLVLQLDHINGNNKDNRIENLRLLCPNCHSQTETYARRKVRRIQKHCKCGKPIRDVSEKCSSCYHREAPTVEPFTHHPKINWPSNEELSEMLWKLPTSTIAEHLGVTDGAILLYCKAKNISKPPRGYWAKLLKGLPRGTKYKDIKI